MSRLPILVFAILLSWLGISEHANAQSLLSPPFGLKWGDSPAGILNWAEKQKLDVSINLPGKQPDQRHIVIKPTEGHLPDHEASSLEARFAFGKLYEVTLHYADPKLSASVAKAKFFNALRALTARHGKFKLSGKHRDSDNGFVTESVSYHIEPVSGLFLMISHTEVRDTLRHSDSSRFSLIYHNDNIVPQQLK